MANQVNISDVVVMMQKSRDELKEALKKASALENRVKTLTTEAQLLSYRLARLEETNE